MIGLSIVGVCTKKPCSSKAFFCPFSFFVSALPLQSKPKEAVTHLLLLTSYLLPKMEPKYKVNPLTGELQEYVFEYNGILALRNFTARVEDERLILHAADDVNFSILEALVSEVEINGVVYNNPTAAQEALTRLTFNQNRPVLLDKSLKDLILGAVQKVEGKGLSSNDFTNEEKQKNEENALKRVANLTVTGDVNKIITLTFADSTVIQAPFKDNDHIPSADVNMNSLNFNVNTGVLTGVKNDGNEITVTLDGRYALISHNHDEQYAAKEHTHSEYAPINHTHNWNDIVGKPNNLATTENIKTAIDEIQIGGRNYVLKSKEKQTLVGYVGKYWALSEPVVVGEQYTFSCYASVENGRRLSVYFIDIAGQQRQYIIADLVSGYNEISVIPKYTWGGLCAYHEVVGISPAPTATIEKLKFERGNKPTDWTPAPEDLANDRVGISIGDNQTYIVPKEQVNNTIYAKSNATIDCSQIPHLGSISVIKVYDGGQVAFACSGKNIIYTTDNTFNGKKGSTAVVSIYENDCYIRISNV